MIPSEGKDFTGSHGGFQSEEKRGLYLPAGWSVQVIDDSGRLVLGYSAPSSGWFTWPFYTPNGIDANPLPLPDGDTK